VLDVMFGLSCSADVHCSFENLMVNVCNLGLECAQCDERQKSMCFFMYGIQSRRLNCNLPKWRKTWSPE
jgi:hypothetical protein